MNPLCPLFRWGWGSGGHTRLQSKTRRSLSDAGSARPLRFGGPLPPPLHPTAMPSSCIIAATRDATGAGGLWAPGSFATEIARRQSRRDRDEPTARIRARQRSSSYILQRARTKISLRKRHGCTMARVKGDEIYRAARLAANDRHASGRERKRGFPTAPAERNAKIRVSNRIMKIIIRADYGIPAHAHEICARKLIERICRILVPRARVIRSTMIADPIASTRFSVVDDEILVAAEMPVR